MGKACLVYRIKFIGSIAARRNLKRAEKEEAFPNNCKHENGLCFTEFYASENLEGAGGFFLKIWKTNRQVLAQNVGEGGGNKA